MLAQDKVERIRDLQCFLVAIDGNNIYAEAFDQSGIIGRDSRKQAELGHIAGISLVCSAQGGRKETLGSLDSSKTRTVEIASQNLNGLNLAILSPADGVGHGQNRDNRLGAGADSFDNSAEHPGRSQSACSIVDQHDFRTTGMFQGQLHRLNTVPTACYSCDLNIGCSGVDSRVSGRKLVDFAAHAH